MAPLRSMRLLRTVAERHPEIEQRLMRALGEELCEAQMLMLTLGRKSALERLAWFLLMLARRAVHRGERTNPLRLCMTRTNIADCLGLTDETVSRTFGQLAERGLIRVLNRHEVRLLNRGALEQIAEGAAEPNPCSAASTKSRRRSR